ncbi:MAG: DUF3808 domain-containing protein [Deltaproteobacteria bacterium]|nr:DUF3808 domain-containing protein [Deltaproteobacteria bacterium]
MNQFRRISVALGVIALMAFMLVYFGICGSKRKPQDEKYYHERGLTLYKEGFYDLLPEGNVEQANEKFEQAVSAFQTAISLNDNHIESHQYLARVFAVQKKYSAAVSEHFRITELDPDNINNYLFLASIYVRMKRYDDAEKVLKHAKTLSKEPAVIEQVNVLIKKIRESPPR